MTRPNKKGLSVKLGIEGLGLFCWSTKGPIGLKSGGRWGLSK